MKRERVEIILIDNSQVAIIESNYDGRPVCHFPGGGVENDNFNVAAIKEVSEELGVFCHPLAVLDYEEEADSFGSGFKAYRKDIYESVRTRFVVARLQSLDTSVYGTDDDAERFMLLDIDDAIARVTPNEDSEVNHVFLKNRKRVLELAKQYI